MPQQMMLDEGGGGARPKPTPAQKPVRVNLSIDGHEATRRNVAAAQKAQATYDAAPSWSAAKALFERTGMWPSDPEAQQKLRTKFHEKITKSTTTYNRLTPSARASADARVYRADPESVKAQRGIPTTTEATRPEYTPEALGESLLSGAVRGPVGAFTDRKPTAPRNWNETAGQTIGALGSSLAVAVPAVLATSAMLPGSVAGAIGAGGVGALEGMVGGLVPSALSNVGGVRRGELSGGEAVANTLIDTAAAVPGGILNRMVPGLGIGHTLLRNAPTTAFNMGGSLIKGQPMTGAEVGMDLGTTLALELATRGRAHSAANVNRARDHFDVGLEPQTPQNPLAVADQGMARLQSAYDAIDPQYGVPGVLNITPDSELVHQTLTPDFDPSTGSAHQATEHLPIPRADVELAPTSPQEVIAALRAKIALTKDVKARASLVAALRKAESQAKQTVKGTKALAKPLPKPAEPQVGTGTSADAEAIVAEADAISRRLYAQQNEQAMRGQMEAMDNPGQPLQLPAPPETSVPALPPGGPNFETVGAPFDGHGQRAAEKVTAEATKLTGTPALPPSHTVFAGGDVPKPQHKPPTDPMNPQARASEANQRIADLTAQLKGTRKGSPKRRAIAEQLRQAQQDFAFWSTEAAKAAPSVYTGTHPDVVREHKTRIAEAERLYTEARIALEDALGDADTVDGKSLANADTRNIHKLSAKELRKIVGRMSHTSDGAARFSDAVEGLIAAREARAEARSQTARQEIAEELSSLNRAEADDEHIPAFDDPLPYKNVSGVQERPFGVTQAEQASALTIAAENTKDQRVSAAAAAARANALRARLAVTPTQDKATRAALTKAIRAAEKQAVEGVPSQSPKGKSEPGFWEDERGQAQPFGLIETVLSKLAGKAQAKFAKDSKDAVVMGAAILKKGVGGRAAFDATLKARYGRRMMPYADDLWNKAQQMHASLSQTGKNPGLAQVVYGGALDPETMAQNLVMTGDSGIPSAKAKQVAGNIVESISTVKALPDEKYFVNNLNIEKINDPDDVKRVLFESGTAYAEESQVHRRGERGWDVTERAGKALGMGPDELARRKIGQAYNAEQLDRAVTVLENSATNVKDLALTVAQGKNADADIIKLATAVELHKLLQAQTEGAIAEAGRALNILKKLRSADSVQAINNALEDIGGKADMEALAKRLAGMDEAGIAKAARDLRKGSPVWEVWYNSVLSDPMTQTANFVGNVISTAVKPVERIVASAMTGGKTIPPGQVLAEIAGSFRGVAEGLAAFKQAFQTEQSVYTNKNAIDVDPHGAIEDWMMGKGVSADTSVTVGRNMRVASRLMLAADDLFKGITYRSTLNGMAYKQALDEGLSGKAFADRMKGLIENPTDVMKEASFKEANYRTFTNKIEGGSLPGNLALSVLKLRKEHPVAMRPFTAFVTTPYNLMRFGFERSLLAATSDRMRAALTSTDTAVRADAWSKVLVGTLLSGMAAAGVLDGRITGSGPSDPAERKAKMLTGWQPYSIKVGDTWVSYAKLQPYASLLATAADLTEYAMGEDERTPAKATAKLLESLGRTVESMPGMQGMDGLSSALQGKPTDLVNVLENFITGFMPYGGAVKGANRAMDPTYRRTEGFMDRVRNRIPGGDINREPVVDVFGNVPERQAHGFVPALERALSPIAVSRDTHDDVASELDRLNLAPTPPKRVRTKDDVQYHLSPTDYTVHSMRTGQDVRRELEAVVYSQWYQQLSDQEKRKELQKAIKAARKLNAAEADDMAGVVE